MTIAKLQLLAKLARQIAHIALLHRLMLLCFPIKALVDFQGNLAHPSGQQKIFLVHTS